MENRIKSIVQAFSMQPEVLQVLETNIGYWKPEEAIKEIKLEDKYFDGELLECYVGYNFEGKMLFRYIAKTVNVHYFV